MNWRRPWNGSVPPMDSDDLACAVAALWGFAEATLFFIVPDAWLSWLGMRSARAGIRACGWALAGALLGGTVMYTSASLALPATEREVEGVPGVHHASIEAVRVQIARRGLVAVLLGPIQGHPYKIYATEWGGARRGLAAFLLISVPARAMRFLLSALAATLLGRALSRWMGFGIRRQRAVLIAGWLSFYGWYFFW